MAMLQHSKRNGTFWVRSQAGQMLLEIVVAIGIIGLVLVGVSDLMTRSVSVSTYQKQKDESLIIIQKMLVDYKRQRDADPDTFYTNAQSTTFSPCEEGVSYDCTVTMDVLPESVLITITASWQDGGKSFSTSLSESLSRQIR